MFVSTVTVDGHQRMADAAVRTAALSDDAYVVVRRRADYGPLFHAVRAGSIRSLAARDGDATVIDALGLRQQRALRSVQLVDIARRPDAADGAITVVLDGAGVEGLLVADAGGRGDVGDERVGAPPAPYLPPAMAPPPTGPIPLPAPALPSPPPRREPGPITGVVPVPGFVPVPDPLIQPDGAPPPAAPAPAAPPPAAPPPAASPPPASAPPPPAPAAPPPPTAPPPAASPPAASPPPASAPSFTPPAPGGDAPRVDTTTQTIPIIDDPAAPFTSHPRIDSPGQVVVGRPFDVVVGLAPRPAAGTAGGPVTVETALAEFDLIVSITAPGFSATRTRDVLHVVRADPASERVTFTLTPEPIEDPIGSALLQVDFSFGGLPCGRAWHAVIVSSGGVAPTLVGPVPGPVPGFSTPVQVLESERPPDLVITVTENDDSTQLDWQFDSRHAGLPVPDRPVRTRFRQHNAKSFAMQQVRLIHESAGAGAVGNRVLGVARTIADQVPPEAWQVLAAVWQRTAQEGRPPAVLLVSTDAYIPWELASTEQDYIDPQLVDTSLPPLLGAQTAISRWNAPRPRGAGGLLFPPLPPPESLDVRVMTLVIGDYLATSGQRALPKAMEEGDELAALYRAVRLVATLGEIDALFDGTLVRDGAPVVPDIVHFACHGQIDPNPRFNGIVLNEGHARLDALYVAGSRLRGSFVFINACQVGQTTELLDDAGGLATAFLRTGASGFVAPLWNIDDQIAKDTALGFYRAALDDRVPVAEVLRRRRALFDPAAPTPQPTHLAYVYYGHPNLVLARAA